MDETSARGAKETVLQGAKIDTDVSHGTPPVKSCGVRNGPKQQKDHLMGIGKKKELAVRRAGGIWRKKNEENQSDKGKAAKSAPFRGQEKVLDIKPG